MLIGPSHKGDAITTNYSDGRPNSNVSQVHNFARYVKPNDYILMRFGKEIISVGIIPEEQEHQYSFNENFKCVFGWDLSHCRRVIWADKLDIAELRDVYKGTRQKPSFTQVHENKIIESVNQLDNNHFKRDLKLLPDIKHKTYSEEELGKSLFLAGISNRNIEEIINALNQANRLREWYSLIESGKWRPSEHEVISHMILPLFLGLGWSHQQMAVEWGNVDMAFFKGTPTVEENCIMILEAKGLNYGLTEAVKQPLYYIDKYNLINVRHILVTDGVNIFMYEKENDSWNKNPVAYLCIWSLQREYILPKGTNAVQTLVKLQPSEI